MKTQILITAAFSTFLAMFSQANAGEKALSKNQVPKKILEAFEKAHPNAKGVKFEEETFEGKTAYEAEYKQNRNEHEFLYATDGSLVQREEGISTKALPEPIAHAIRAAYPKAKIKEAEKIMNPTVR